MLGGVVLTRGDSVVRGQRLVYDLASGHATVDGGSVGGAAAPGTTTTSGYRGPTRPPPAAPPTPAK